MKINRIKFNVYKKVNIKKYTKSETSCLQHNSDINFRGIDFFNIKIKNRQKSEEKYAKDYFFGYGKPSQTLCEDIIKNHPLTLQKAYKLVEKANRDNCPTLSQTPNITAKAGFCFKRYFDKKYQNYRIISLGTSPASISQAIEYLGAEVIYIPVSGAGKLEQEENGVKATLSNRADLSRIKNLNVIIDYLKSKAKNHDKNTNIVLDFTCTGATLEIMTKIFNKTAKSCGTFVSESLDSAIFFATMENIAPITSGLSISDKEANKILNDCNLQSAEDIANVPHFDIDDSINQKRISNDFDNYISSKGKNNESIFWEFENYSSELARAYSLCTYNELKKLDLI